MNGYVLLIFNIILFLLSLKYTNCLWIWMVNYCSHFTYSDSAVEIGIGIRRHEEGKSDLQNTPLDITLLFDLLWDLKAYIIWLHFNKHVTWYRIYAVQWHRRLLFHNVGSSSFTTQNQSANDHGKHFLKKAENAFNQYFHRFKCGFFFFFFPLTKKI